MFVYGPVRIVRLSDGAIFKFQPKRPNFRGFVERVYFDVIGSSAR